MAADLQGSDVEEQTEALGEESLYLEPKMLRRVGPTSTLPVLERERFMRRALAQP